MRPNKGVCASHFVLACLAFLLLFNVQLSNAADTLTAGKVMKDWEFLESQNAIFQLGFFNPVYSSNRYLGIRFMKYNEMKMVWVANRENPLNDTSGYLNITQDGYLVIRDERGSSITINLGEPATGSNTSVTLLDSGNLVLKAGQRVVWQSFDHPTDTLLPGMKFGLFDLKPRQPQKLLLTSWVSPGVPAAGAFTLGVDPNNTKQLEVLRRGVPYWRSGNWNGKNFSYFPVDPNYGESLKFSYTSNENESYFTYALTEYNYSWIEVNSTGDIYLYVAGIDFWTVGVEITCDIGNEYSPEGCIEQKTSSCRGGDKFVFIFGAMDSWIYLNNYSLGLRDCQQICRNNCSCKAYSSALADGSGCSFSYGQKFDDPPPWLMASFYIRNITAQNNSKIAPNEGINNTSHPAPPPVTLSINKEPRTNKQKWGIIVSVPVSFAVTCSLCYLIWKKCFSKEKRGSSQMQVGRETQQFINDIGTSIAAMDEGTSRSLMLKAMTDHELPLFSFSIIEAATGHFSEANKLGQGGFGPVYKGKLVEGQEIAVKRLSERSGQGIEEFKNEVVLISKVQHRNLVRLFGCCIKGEEKILIYEYLPNKSLDTFLFDEKKRQLLNWRMRINIVEGIVQGLLYLHKYSRLKIVHRDLKTSNILLDNNMNPKISDFGTAKIFGENESRANTNRIVGTYGYMSPEYAMDGLFSVKSDVFSFGVMMLEIISGKKNTGFYQSNHLNLVRYAWNLWKEDRSLELMDPTLAETCSTNELERCVQVALLCVQENAADRPTMSDVVSMLGSDTSTLPQPKQSSISTTPRVNDNELPDNSGSSSINNVTISSIHAR